MKIKITSEELNGLELRGLSEQQIADILKCSRMALYNYRKRINSPQLLRSDKGTERISSEIKRANRNKYHVEYNKTHRTKRNQRQQRRIAIQVLGRRLKQGEVMHHIDGNPNNNSHNNLVICTQSYHMSVLHGKRQPKT